MKPIVALLLCLGTGGSGIALGQPPADKTKPRYDRRWVYAAYNLLIDKSADDVIALIGRAAKSGYNGIVLADYKFNVLERLPPRYFKNVARVQQAATVAGIEIIPTVCPIGYSAGLLAHDPNLAEGVPVKDAPFLARGGQLIPLPGAAAHLVNGDLEDVKGDRFRGWNHQDEPGKATFADRAVVRQGKVAVRMQDFPKHHPVGNCRLAQRVKVRPYACYRFSGWIKTRDLKPAGNFKLAALAGKGGRVLTFFDDPIKPTQNWTRVEAVFNSLDNSELTLFAGIWNGRAGTLWLDDLVLEELSLVNVLRRGGCPLSVTSEDGKTVYEEGKDFQPVSDPKLGRVPNVGDYGFRHAGPTVRLTASSRIKEGDKLRLGWYHPLPTHSYQVMCCLSEPKVYEILRDQVRRVQDLLKPKTFFLSHDEIRVANWCRACQERKLTPGALLADNVRRCAKIIKEINPEAQLIVWSDMFDPHHNAVEQYYLVNGSLTGSWDGLPANMMMANWNGGKAAQSLKWFAQRGHGQIIAGYYDGDLENFKRWHAAAREVPSVRGFLYTTWQHRYDYLEAYGKALLGKE